ncbi:ZIP family metal transporter [Oceanicola sp. 502str15]|uniref:ZIP family metal transporter n=1 Tax=Oceanicola sp. 502str15 TaxID=2696061 RepID=UPI0020941AF2|nr:zinc transporter [Oceanicola sp. 502str15]MCO6385164.1 zinc transporter [Oceanicola sp. 502str15]
MLFLTVAVVSAALIIGAAWGLWGKLPKGLEGFMVAMAGGALMVSVTIELIQPALQQTSLIELSVAVAAGALVFTGLDWWIEKQTEGSEGAGLLLAITLDGIPENLALGVALIGAGVPEVAALAGSILLSNLPEAAGGAKEMREGEMGRGRIMWLWTGTALILAAAAIIGNFALAGVDDEVLALIRGFAAGAVTASLATEVFPQAFREERYGTGVAVTLGLLIAFALSTLSGG